MDLEPFVRRAQEGDVKAYVELTRGYKHLAFGSALALIHDLQQAEDVVQFPAPVSAMDWVTALTRRTCWLFSYTASQSTL
jgi:hypothetical protein